MIQSKTVAVIVAHPDDETLWAGGTLLTHPYWKCFIVCLCRGSDSERAPKFYEALQILKSEGIMGDLDDGPEQKPLAEEKVERTILDLLPIRNYDLIITHNRTGEYTRHIRHEEINKAVIRLWDKGKILTNEIWTFAYEDGNKEYYPRSVEGAPVFRKLSQRIWLRKFNIITETYNFPKESWEAKTTPRTESFWQFSDPDEAKKIT
jgi:LmbE family N-acetylglucosaminyl deacetylase